MITHVLVQNTGTIGTPATFTSPYSVTDGTIAAFNELGAGIDMSGANTAKYQLVLGDDDRPVLTAFIDPATATVEKKTYVAPVKQSNAIVIPAGPTGGAFYNIKVRVIRDLIGGSREAIDSHEPYITSNFELEVADSETAAAIIDRFVALINAAGVTRPYTASTNKVITETLTGTSGTANITIDGEVYLVTFNTSLTQTAADFVTSHAATILAVHGYTVTSSGADIIFTQTSGTAGDPSDAINATGDLAGTVATTQASTTLVISAVNFRTIFVTAFDGFSPTVTVTPMEEGSGWGLQLQEMEARTRGTFSDYYQETNLLGSVDDGPEINASLSGQYLLYVIRNPNDADRNINRSFEHSEIVLALEAGVTGDFDTFLGV